MKRNTALHPTVSGLVSFPRYNAGFHAVDTSKRKTHTSWRISAEHTFLLNVRAFILLRVTLQFFLLHNSLIPFICLTSNSSQSLLGKPVPGLYASFSHK